MHLERFNHIISPLYNQNIINVKLVELYYVYEGRNAWHSTYSTHFTDKCMHPNLESAKEYCENCRVQGSVFHIIKLPALAISTHHITLLVTEINTNMPLSRFSYEKFINLACVVRAAHSDLRWTTILSKFVQVLCPINGLWNAPTRTKDSVFLFNGTGVKLEWSESFKSEQYKSFSNGSGYFLGWTKSDSIIKCDGVNKLINILTSPLSRKYDDRNFNSRPILKLNK